ncbi:MAG TPA: alkaline phosphatase family protein [Candidatus Dormibacteraeota bacterium]|jgi:phospholipase C
MVRRAAVGLAATLLLAVCGGSSPAAGTGTTPPSTPAISAPPAAAATHVFVIVMENRGYTEAMAQPYTARLAVQYAIATNYHAVSHPSLPNYLALAGGSTFGITDDGYHRLAPGGVGAQLSERGISWRAYMEGLTRGCLDSPSPYAVKHNPFAYFGGACPANVVPLTALDRDLAGATPSFVWITPDLCHDGHDCGSRQADDFLSGLVPRILASAAWQQGGLLLVTWDEDDGHGDNRVPAIVVAQGLTSHTTAQRHDHYSLLATVEDRLGVPRLGRASQATPLNELFA